MHAFPLRKPKPLFLFLLRRSRLIPQPVDQRLSWPFFLPQTKSHTKTKGNSKFQACWGWGGEGGSSTPFSTNISLRAYCSQAIMPPYTYYYVVPEPVALKRNSYLSPLTPANPIPWYSTVSVLFRPTRPTRSAHISARWLSWVLANRRREAASEIEMLPAPRGCSCSACGRIRCFRTAGQRCSHARDGR